MQNGFYHVKFYEFIERAIENAFKKTLQKAENTPKTSHPLKKETDIFLIPLLVYQTVFFTHFLSETQLNYAIVFA